jgi:hypothetical protein
VHISEVVHDDKALVDGILGKYGIHSSKDLWHKCKSICAKLRDDLVKACITAIAAPQHARAACDLKSLTVEKLKEYLKAHGLD